MNSSHLRQCKIFERHLVQHPPIGYLRRRGHACIQILHCPLHRAFRHADPRLAHPAQPKQHIGRQVNIPIAAGPPAPAPIRILLRKQPAKSVIQGALQARLQVRRIQPKLLHGPVSLQVRQEA